MRDVQYFFNKRHMLREWNCTHICLIPKVEILQEPRQLRRIILCSVIYKIVSKIITNRRKPIIRTLISLNHNAFVLDRILVDNCMIAHENFIKLIRNVRGKEYLAALQLDMFKAYGKVN